MFDLILSVSGRPFPTSRALLMEKSAYFRAVLETRPPLAVPLAGGMSHLALPALISHDIFALLIAGKKGKHPEGTVAQCVLIDNQAHLEEGLLFGECPR